MQGLIWQVLDLIESRREVEITLNETPLHRPK
jgi:hypothetical protein